MVPVLGVLAFVLPMAGIGPFRGHWLPENINDHGHVIDNLFMFILYLTGAIFIATGLVLFWFIWKYDGGTNKEPFGLSFQMAGATVTLDGKPLLDNGAFK